MQLKLGLAAMHTRGTLLTHILFDLAAGPESLTVTCRIGVRFFVHTQFQHTVLAATLGMSFTEATAVVLQVGLDAVHQATYKPYATNLSTLFTAPEQSAPGF